MMHAGPVRVGQGHEDRARERHQAQRDLLGDGAEALETARRIDDGVSDFGLGLGSEDQLANDSEPKPAPPVSSPSDAAQSPAATAMPDPDDEPPGSWSRFQGFRGWPNGNC